MRLRLARADRPPSTLVAVRGSEARPAGPQARWSALAAASVPLAVLLTVVIAGVLPLVFPALSVFPLVALCLFGELWALLFFALRSRPVAADGGLSSLR